MQPTGEPDHAAVDAGSGTPTGSSSASSPALAVAGIVLEPVSLQSLVVALTQKEQ